VCRKPGEMSAENGVQHTTEERDMSKVQKSIEIDRPVTQVYNQWTQFEDFPAFMDGVEDVQQLTEDKLRWKTSIAGVDREFETEIIEQEPDQRISWRTEDGEDHTGAVTFDDLGGNATRVTVVMSYRPENWVEKVGDALNILDRRVEKDLERFKKLIEDEATASGGWRGRISSRDVLEGDPHPDVPSTERP
jgi:uncharacterized membrane protein